MIISRRKVTIGVNNLQLNSTAIRWVTPDLQKGALSQLISSMGFTF